MMMMHTSSWPDSANAEHTPIVRSLMHFFHIHLLFSKLSYKNMARLRRHTPSTLLHYSVWCVAVWLPVVRRFGPKVSTAHIVKWKLFMCDVKWKNQQQQRRPVCVITVIVCVVIVVHKPFFAVLFHSNFGIFSNRVSPGWIRNFWILFRFCYSLSVYGV